MKPRSLVALGSALFVATMVAGPVPARDARVALTQLEATNQLMAIPWVNVSRQAERDAERSLEGLEGKKLAGGSGSVGITYKGVGVKAKWAFGVTAHAVKAKVDLSAPPGFVAASRR